MPPGIPPIPTIKTQVISKNPQVFKHMVYRYPFVAADVLVSCIKIADALVKEKETEV